MPNILINPNSGILEFNTGIAGSSAFDTNLSGLRMTYNNFGAINLLSYNTNPSSGVDRFTIDGTNGRLFSVTDNLSGSLFSVNDIAGLPIIEAFDDNTVIMGAFNRNDFVLSGNSLGLGAVPNTGTTKLYVGGNLLVSGNIFISGNQVFTGIGPFATTSNLFATGSTLDNKINSLSGYVTGITGTFGTLPANLYSTGSILDNKINSLSGYVNSQDNIFSGQTFNTGSRLDNKINSLSGYVNSQDIIFSGQAASTGSILDIKINSLSGLFAAYTGSLDATFATDIQLFNTGSILDNKVNSLSGYVNSRDLLFSGQTASTGSILNTRINNLSGYINSANSNIVFTTGNQTISGNKNFYGDMLLSGANNRIGKSQHLSIDNDFVYIKQADGSIILSAEENTLFDQQVPSVVWSNRALVDQNNVQALNWSSRYLTNNAGTIVLTWAGNNIGIGTNTPSEKLTVVGNVIANNLVYNTGNQTISGVKSFAQDTVFGDSAQGDFLVISGNTFTVYGSGNFTSGLFINGNPVLTGSSTLYATSANLASTGSTLNSSINSLSGTLTGNYATILNLASTGNTLNTRINSLSGTLTGNYLTTSSASNTYATITNLASTGSTLNTKIDNLSGVSVLTFGNQIINGVKTFANGSNQILNTTYSTLTGLKAISGLLSGQLYRISDFVLKWNNQSNNDQTVKTAASGEPLIVTALSNNKIYHLAQSEIYPQDTIYYNIDASTSYSWGAINNNVDIPDFKGWIYRRVDNLLNIDIPYDWRNMTVNCCKPDVSSVPYYFPYVQYNKLDYVIETGNNSNRGKLYYSNATGNSGNALSNTNFWHPVSNFVESGTFFSTDESYGFRALYDDLNLGDFIINLPALTSSRIQQPTFTSILTGLGAFTLSNVKNIKIEDGYSNVIIGNNFSSNIIGTSFSSNTIDNGFHSNTIGDDFISNTIGNNFYYNTIGNGFGYNIISQFSYANNIGNNFSFNTISNEYFHSNTIGNNFYFNIIGTSFSSNTIDNGFHSNTIRSSFISNTIGNYFYSNTIRSSFVSNTIGSNFYNNTIGNDFNTNTIANNFYYNTIGNDFYTNTIANNFNYNTIGNSFNSNTSEDNFSNINFTSSTHVYNNYNTTLFQNSANSMRLRYFNSSDQLVVTDPTA